MDMITSSIYKLPLHKHPLLPSSMFIKLKCDGCQVEEIMYGDNSIRHFTHEEHVLLLLKDYDMVGDDYERLRCAACICPTGFGPIYRCQECHFVLHEKFGVSRHGCICNLCGVLSDGFKYTSQGFSPACLIVDVHCGSVSEPFLHNGHLHPLYFVETNKEYYCNACRRAPDHGYMLSYFELCLYCATLPEKIWHISDEHPLTLYCSGKAAMDKNWCQVCEMELDSSKWFFTCSDCGVTLHVQCVLEISHKEYCVVFNNQNSRPFCRHCHDRCKASVILQYKDLDEQNGYICSKSCLYSYSGLELEYDLM
ncbi:hypothetical protein N665_0433s0059 [Sinapis alba]|nr:hypothetical protein N665_0433s0059 [Sinapis alba]